MSSYATGAELIVRFDADVVGDLAGDTRQPVSNPANHANVAAALADASGEIDVSLQAGGRYTPAQLAALTGNSRNHLIRVTCDLAMHLLFKRRPGVLQDVADAMAKQAREHLVSLRKGDNVFGIPDNIGASAIDLETISAAHIDQRNLLPSRMGRFFPTTDQRSSRIP